MIASSNLDLAFVDHTPETAPDASRAALRATAAHLGFLPSAMARLAESPSVTAAFGRLMALWEACSLALVEREVVTLTVAHRAGCEVCVAMHAAIMARAVADAPLLEALRAQRPLADGRLEALRQFTRAVLASHGGVTDAELRAFLAAGFSRQQALDVVLGVGTYTLSTTANRLTRAPLDRPLEPFAWTAESRE
ncbi:carboxymuconolactone decarboxylase family protein [soil metagenome]